MINIAEMIGIGQNNIFFIEADDSLTEFHPRLLCAFESAALHNPDQLVIFKNAVLVIDHLFSFPYSYPGLCVG